MLISRYEIATKHYDNNSKKIIVKNENYCWKCMFSHNPIH